MSIIMRLGKSFATKNFYPPSAATVSKPHHGWDKPKTEMANTPFDPPTTAIGLNESRDHNQMSKSNRSKFSLILIITLLIMTGITQSQDVSNTPEATEEPAFDPGIELTIDYLRNLEIEGSTIWFEQELEKASNYSQYIVSYESEGNNIKGLLTIPFGIAPEGGFKAIVFNHGYIPPSTYVTTERYVAYVGALAQAGFVVFKIDMRGHGKSEGESQGSYYHPGYTIDAITALKSLQMLDFIDPDGIGMWGHSMAGNLVLRAMLVEPDVKAGVIWGGAVFSYDDFAKYGISDNSFNPAASTVPSGRPRMGQILREAYGTPDTTQPYWQAVSLTEHLEYLNNPIQLHHAVNDSTVNIGYSIDLANILLQNGKLYEYYSYAGGDHNISSPYFEEAMQRTIDFYKANL